MIFVITGCLLFLVWMIAIININVVIPLRKKYFDVKAARHELKLMSDRLKSKTEDQCLSDIDRQNAETELYDQIATNGRYARFTKNLIVFIKCLESECEEEEFDNAAFKCGMHEMDWQAGALKIIRANIYEKEQ